MNEQFQGHSETTSSGSIAQSAELVAFLEGVERILSRRARGALWFKLVNGFDSYERHALAGSFIRHFELGNVLDLGGVPGLVKPFLGRQRCRITTANVVPPADILYDGGHLPVEDRSYAGVTCLDVLEHVQPEQRVEFLSDLLRVAAGPILLSVPHRSDAHYEAERKLHDRYIAVTGRGHPFLAEHLQNGLVNERDMANLLSSIPAAQKWHYDRFFTGDFVQTAGVVERILQAKARGRLVYWAKLPRLAWRRAAPGQAISFHLEAKPNTNRMYVLLQPRHERGAD